MFRAVRALTGVGAIVAGLCMLAAPCASAEDGAVPRLTGALAAQEAHVGRESPDLLPVIAQLAEAQLRDGALGKALALRRRALAIAIAAFGCDTPRAAAAMAALAALDVDRGNYLDAEPLLIIARRTMESGSEPDPQTRSMLYTGLARVALARGATRRAEQWANRAVAAAQADPASASSAPWRALGAALTAEQRFDDAARVLDMALARDRSRFGDDAPETARSLSQLANLQLRRGQPAAALPLIEQAAAIDQAQLGPNHPSIADDFYDAGLAYEALHRDTMAQRSFTFAIGIAERGSGHDTTRVAYAEIELNRLYLRQGDKAAADAMFRDARRILDRAEAEERRRQRRA